MPPTTPQPSEADYRLIDAIRRLGKGRILVIVKNGVPVRIRTEKEYDLAHAPQAGGSGAGEE